MVEAGFCSLFCRSPKRQSAEGAQNSDNRESMFIILLIDKEPDALAVVRTQMTTMSVLFAACDCSTKWRILRIHDLNE